MDFSSEIKTLREKNKEKEFIFWVMSILGLRSTRITDTSYGHLIQTTQLMKMRTERMNRNNNVDHLSIATIL